MLIEDAISAMRARPSQSTATEYEAMLFMVIERFEHNNMLPAYQRAKDKGRGLPDGLKYINSWIEPNFGRCFQLMECEDLTLFQQWILHWQGTGTSFEIVPVVESGETREVVAPYLSQPTS
jgi:Protein of unknown function (DUF3303)